MLYGSLIEVALQYRVQRQYAIMELFDTAILQLSLVIFRLVIS